MGPYQANWKADKKWDLEEPIDKWATGIKVNEAGRVTQISFTAALADNLWELPEEVGNLTELTTFLRFNKNIKGNLPESIYSLTKLEKLYFSDCELTGTISEKIGQMVSLTEIYLNHTGFKSKLQGAIPASIGNLTKLMKLNVAGTEISSIPAELAQCTALTDIVGNNAKLKRTFFIIGFSPGLSGRRSSSTMMRLPERSTTGRSFAKYSGTIGIFSRLM